MQSEEKISVPAPTSKPEFNEWVKTLRERAQAVAEEEEAERRWKARIGKP
jgi:hypothetical protein